MSPLVAVSRPWIRPVELIQPVDRDRYANIISHSFPCGPRLGPFRNTSSQSTRADLVLGVSGGFMIIQIRSAREEGRDSSIVEQLQTRPTCRPISHYRPSRNGSQRRSEDSGTSASPRSADLVSHLLASPREASLIQRRPGTHIVILYAHSPSHLQQKP